MENHEKFSLLVSGCIRRLPFAIPTDVLNIVNYYAWPVSTRSMNHIAATHLVGQIINDFIIDARNKCTNFQNDINRNINDEFNILKYIYVKGGALRDCHLLRNIKDIDIVVDIHQLTKLHLSHLQKYHKDGNIDNNCPFWQHFLNKFSFFKLKNNSGIIDRKITKYKRRGKRIYRKNIEPFNKIVARLFRYEDYIIRSDYLFNVKFIVEKILKQSKKYKDNINTTTQWYDRNYVVVINDVHYKGMYVTLTANVNGLV